MRRQIIFLILISYAAVCFAGQEREAKEGIELTVYNGNFAVVKDARQLKFESGINEIKFDGVASAIDATSVEFMCLSSSGVVKILEQHYEYDLASEEMMFKRYVGKTVTVWVKCSVEGEGKEVTGELLAAAWSDLILKAGSRMEVINRSNVERVVLKSEVAEEVITKPTLIWLAQAQEKNEQLCEATYITGQLGWSADYTVVLNADDTKIAFSGWVTVDNRSGATYKDAGLKLIAGDVRMVSGRKPVPREQMAVMKGGVGGGFEEKPFMEYHLYTLGRRSTIEDNQAKQIEFIPSVSGVSVRKMYVYNRSEDSKNVQVKLEFENTRQNNLGIPLPAGRVRVFKQSEVDGVTEFMGEDKIEHTAADEKVLLYIGNSFDIVPEYTLVDSVSGWRMQKQTHKVELRNRKAEAVTVFVDEKLQWQHNWKIEGANYKYEKLNAGMARFEVPVAANSTATLQYTVTETW